MEGLKKILETFEGVYKSTAKIQDKEKDLSNQFESLAKQIFYKGHFETDYGIKIYPTDIEFYYHEDAADGLKDPMMYHTNQNLTDGNVKKILGNEYPYFTKCALHFHTSGIDVTFEEPNKYRASFLIRGYKVVGKEKIEETRPTYLYEYIFSHGFTPGEKVIKWVDDNYDMPNHLEGINRQNVYQYDKNGNKTSCERKWRFQKI